MELRPAIKNLLMQPPLVGLYARYLQKQQRKSQTDEGLVLRRLADSYAIPRSFVEFGFHPKEFNCCVLTEDFRGLLLDGNRDSVALARLLLPGNIEVIHKFVDLENLDVIFDYCGSESLGILSVDVDGNDFWFLDRLLALMPAVIVAEYNASMGFRSITVPYSPDFDRRTEHRSGWYHGASLRAIHSLCTARGYSLAAVSSGGCNAFFMRDELNGPNLCPDAAYRENLLRNRWSNTTGTQQWELIKDMPYVEITSTGTPLAGPSLRRSCGA